MGDTCYDVLEIWEYCVRKVAEKRVCLRSLKLLGRDQFELGVQTLEYHDRYGKQHDSLENAEEHAADAVDPAQLERMQCPGDQAADKIEHERHGHHQYDEAHYVQHILFPGDIVGQPRRDRGGETECDNGTCNDDDEVDKLVDKTLRLA